jgi:hypothetical protein
MPSQILLPLSKFNKKHIDTIVNHNQLVKINQSTFDSLKLNDFDSLKSIYLSPNIQQNNITVGYYFSDELRQYFQQVITDNTTTKNNLPVLSTDLTRTYIYPFSADEYKAQHLAGYSPYEQDFLFNIFLNKDDLPIFNRIIDCNSYLIIMAIPLTVEEHKIFSYQWKSVYSINAILPNLATIEKVYKSYIKELDYYYGQNEQLLEENNNLKQQLNFLTEELIKSNKVTWN